MDRKRRNREEQAAHDVEHGDEQHLGLMMAWEGWLAVLLVLVLL